MIGVCAVSFQVVFPVRSFMEVATGGFLGRKAHKGNTGDQFTQVDDSTVGLTRGIGSEYTVMRCDAMRL